LAIAGTRFAMARNLRGWRMQLFASWLPLLINFHIIGIWHGANLTFVLFGLIHGLWFILETETRQAKWWKKWKKNSSDRARRLIGQALTFLPMMITFSLFRSADIDDFFALFGYLNQNWFEFFEAGRSHFIAKTTYLNLLAAFGVIWLMPNAYGLLTRYRAGIITFPVENHTPAMFCFIWRPTVFWATLMALAGSIILIKMGTPAPFVYGGF
jgi:alginate O-acetyltransferase complex protein AlgI